MITMKKILPATRQSFKGIKIIKKQTTSQSRDKDKIEEIYAENGQKPRLSLQPKAAPNLYPKHTFDKPLQTYRDSFLDVSQQSRTSIPAYNVADR